MMCDRIRHDFIDMSNGYKCRYCGLRIPPCIYCGEKPELFYIRDRVYLRCKRHWVNGYHNYSNIDEAINGWINDNDFNKIIYNKLLEYDDNDDISIHFDISSKFLKKINTLKDKFLKHNVKFNNKLTSKKIYSKVTYVYEISIYGKKKDIKLVLDDLSYNDWL